MFTHHTRSSESLDQYQSLLSSTQTNYSSVEHDSELNRKKTATIEASDKKSILTHDSWQLVFDRFSTSVYLENKGSVARDHLANERTYLAWLRTSLSTIAVGIAITQLFRLHGSLHPEKNPPMLLNGHLIGLFFILISMLFLVFAVVRFFHTQVAMIHGYFPSSRSTVSICSGLLFLAMILVLITISSQ